MNIENRYVSGKEILDWQSIELSKGGEVEEIEWLLDIGGGFSCSSFAKLKIIQDRKYQLKLSLEKLSTIWERYLYEKIPLQYLLGKCPWRDFEIEVNPSALIPRPETELLIDIALDKIQCSLNRSGIWVDLGTGSGVLAIALARALPDWNGHAVDCSKDTLALAKKNFKNLVFDSSVSLHLGNWFEPLHPFLLGKVDLIVSNPPYIPTSFLSELDLLVSKNEPRLALCGGIDGLSSLREVIKGSIAGLRSSGWLLVEHHQLQCHIHLQHLDFQLMKNQM